MSILFQHLKGQYHVRLNEGSNILHLAAWHASVRTIELLCSIKYTTSNVGTILNSPDMYGWKTPYEYICSRRRDNQNGARYLKGILTSDEDPEKLYTTLMGFIQKIVDDHYGFVAHQGHGEGKLKRRMVAVPRKGSTKFVDIVEEDSLLEVLEDDPRSDTPETPVKVEEQWYDAYEDVREAICGAAERQ
ncbi:MAG: hypothetical protein Q9199_000555 [Rusavskia elegans]